MEPLALSILEERIEYQFENKSLLKQAVTHSSYANEQKIRKLADYERIEFLGDAVLELVSSEFFYHRFPDLSEGRLTKMRASAVCEQALAITARQLEIGNFLLLGRGEEATGGRDRDSMIADAVEAVVGAIYLDGGFFAAKTFIHKFILNDLENKKLFYDAKSVLQEEVQNQKLGVLSYELVGEKGPEHDKAFYVAALLNGERIGTGVGHNKKAAEQKAAYEAIIAYQKNRE